MVHRTSKTVDAGKPEPRVAKELMCSKLRHHRTFRGHSSAVYVLAIDHESRYVLSGSDDAVMKIWSLSTGVLLNSCRGHEVCETFSSCQDLLQVYCVFIYVLLLLQGEITDVKISCDSKMVASSSTDTVIRVWSLEAENLGHPVAVLMGCAKMINYLDWHPILPNALASVSADGSCRIWDATTGTDPIVLRPRDEAPLLPPAPSATTATAALLAGRSTAQESTGAEAPAPEADAFMLTCCAWSRCGTFLAAGGNHCAAYMWMWPVRTIRTAPGSISVRRLQVCTRACSLICELVAIVICTGFIDIITVSVITGLIYTYSSSCDCFIFQELYLFVFWLDAKRNELRSTTFREEI